MAKTILTLYLSYVPGQWIYHHMLYEVRSPYRNKLKQFLQLMMEPRPDDYQQYSFHTENMIVVRLPEQNYPDKRDSKWKHYWIPPEKMKMLDDFLDRMWRDELVMMSMKANMELGDQVKETEVINDFFQMYDISSDELSDESALKVIQRGKLMKFNSYIQHIYRSKNRFDDFYQKNLGKKIAAIVE